MHDKNSSGVFVGRDEAIVESWKLNAEPWTAVVRRQQIESRRLVTDGAIVETVLAHSPGVVLDLGCGEGWLVRALAERGLSVYGVDVVPDLIERARAAGGGRFSVMSYEDITRGALGLRVDIVVCNFALFGDRVVERMFRVMPSLLNSGGVFIVQTLHPMIACGDAPYRTGWREGSWSGFDASFVQPAPWYFRTLEAWTSLFVRAGFRLLEIKEPIHPETQKPASVVFVAELAHGYRQTAERGGE